MKNNEFRQELHHYLDESYDQFVEYQNTVKELFSVFHTACIENNICYYSAFGTLLGIERDKGMIPWDADIDVVVPITEAKNIVKILTEKLPQEYYLISNFIDRNYYLCETRLCKKGLNPDVFHVDIFYLIGAPDNVDEQKKFCRTIRRTYYLRALRYQPITKGQTKRDYLVYYSKKIIKLFLHIVPNFIFNKRCNNLLSKYNFECANYYTTWGDAAVIYPASCFESADLQNVDGQDCFIPNDPGTILEAIYHDYNSYLPISKRYEEFYMWLMRFKEYS